MGVPIPTRGDLWWAYLDPVVGREQGGRRPVLILSRDEYNNSAVGRVIVVPLTTKDRGWPTSVPIDPAAGLDRPTWALSDQIRAIDVKRLKGRIGAVDTETLSVIEQIVRRIIGL